MSCLGDGCSQPPASWKEKESGLVFPRLMVLRARDVIKIAKVKIRIELKRIFQEPKIGREDVSIIGNE